MKCKRQLLLFSIELIWEKGVEGSDYRASDDLKINPKNDYSLIPE